MNIYEEAPPQSYSRLRKFIPKPLQPYLRGLRKRLDRSRHSLKEPYYSAFPYTQVHSIRQENLIRLAGLIEERDIPGAVLECGVLDGGTAALMAYATSVSARDVHLFDSWSGLPDVTDKDGTASKKWAGDVVGSPRRVVSVMRKLDVAVGRIHFHQGWFDQTFATANIDKIALLHIDADFYESVRLSLETWFPKLSVGGFVQIDDYSAFAGCRRAVDEFCAARPEVELDIIGDHTKAYFIEKRL